jgi:uncharacterized protein YndB with AHSA1/START domain
MEAVMSLARVEVVEIIKRPVEQTFEVLTDLAGFNDWMPHAGLFVGTRQTSPGPIGMGTTFDDVNRLGTMRGEVVEFQRPSLVVFKETWPPFPRPLFTGILRYELRPIGGDTLLRHISETELPGIFGLLEPGLRLVGGGERRRTVRALKRAVESSPETSTSATA